MPLLQSILVKAPWVVAIDKILREIFSTSCGRYRAAAQRDNVDFDRQPRPRAGDLAMDPSSDFKSVQDKIQNALVATTKTTNRIAGQDLSFLRTLDSSVADRLDERTGRLLRLSKGLLEAASKTTGQAAPDLEDVDDIDIAWRGTVDVIDSLLEKADTCLDEYTGLIKRKAAPSVDSVRKVALVLRRMLCN